MDEGPSPRKFALRLLLQLVLVIGVLSLLALLVVYLTTPPRLAWASWFMGPGIPRDHKGMEVYGATALEDLRLRLSGNRVVFVYVPPGRETEPRWPRPTGRRHPPAPDQRREEEIEFAPP